MVDRHAREDYLLGTTGAEYMRLMRQSTVLAPWTARLFREAGLERGNRILDLGSGVGDVALLAAELVGNDGQVVGIDIDGRALAIARERAGSHGFAQVTFVETGLAEFRTEEPFDAIVGRLVLQFLPQPLEVLRTLAAILRPGGVMVFQESNWEALLSQVANLPLRRACCQLIYDSFRYSRANLDMGSVFVRGFRELDFDPPRLHLDVPVGVDAETRRWVYDLTCSLYPRFVEFGLEVAVIGELATLAERLEAELTSRDAYAACIGLMGVWSRKPVDRPR